MSAPLGEGVEGGCRHRLDPSGAQGYTPGVENVVLVAHPNQQRLQAIADAMGEAGFNILTADTGSDALATASAYQPQVALLHAELPEVQGTDVCLRLKQEASSDALAVVLLAKDASDEARFVGNQVAADDFLSEACTDAELVERVREQLSRLGQPA